MKNIEDMSLLEKFGVLFGCIILIPAIIALEGWIVMLAWNVVMPAIFSLPTLTFTQGVWVWLLGHMLFGGFSGKD